jgi:hypothetical protein
MWAIKLSPKKRLIAIIAISFTFFLAEIAGTGRGFLDT